MSLESLPNEILLDVFDYFDDTNLFRTFYGLNSRFNDLLYNQCRASRLNFKTISRRNLDMICQQHLPFIADRVIALTLSDGREAPEQINLFCSYIPSFLRLIQLRSLTIVNIRSHETLLEITQECHNLCNLTHLKLLSGYSFQGESTLQLSIDNIWNLPKLTHCELGIYISVWPFGTPTKISTSLEYIYISRCAIPCYQLNQLFYQTPRLKHLAITIDHSRNDPLNLYPLPMLTALNISISSSVDISLLISFFQNTPNLRGLSISLEGLLIDGQRWEQIIDKYLPKLKILRLKMQRYFWGSSFVYDKNEIVELLNSFRSPFWIDQRQWFVRCLKQNHVVYLHTLSSGFIVHNLQPPDFCMSTSPHEERETFYDNINAIYDENIFMQSIPLHTRMSNIQNLRIKLPIHIQFWLIVPSLNRLDSLSIINHMDQCQPQLQSILNRATQLRCLHIHQSISLPLQTSLFTYTNTSLRRLAIRNCGYYFTKDQCTQLIYSPLGAQCDVLSVMVLKRQSIIYLIEKITNLRVLHIECKDDTYSTETISDELVHWLRKHLPSTCSIVRDTDEATSYIRLCL